MLRNLGKDVMKEEKNVKVSIVIPMYNVSDYISNCMKSVTKQTYPNIECIIVNDCSTDDSVAKCESVISSYQGPIQFRILQHEHNRGVSAARNTGTEAVTGQYIFYLDSDDVISNDCIEKMLAPMLKDETIEVVQGRSIIFKSKDYDNLPKGPDMQPVDLVGRDLIEEDFYDNHKWPTGHRHIVGFTVNKLMRIDFIRNNRLYYKEGQLWEDLLWFIYMINCVNHMYLIPDLTYFYCKRPNSITTGTIPQKKIIELGHLYNEVANNFIPEKNGRQAKNMYKAFLNNYARNPEYKQFKSAVKSIRKTLKANHFNKEVVIFTVTEFLLRFKVFRALFRLTEKFFRRK